jgi:hypothetical protein
LHPKFTRSHLSVVRFNLKAVGEHHGPLVVNDAST